MAIYILIKYTVSNRKYFKDIEENRYYIIISLLFLLCCCGMVAGQAMSWMYSIYPNLISNNIGAIQGYKAFSYIRYMGAFIGPFILCSMVIASTKKTTLKNIDIVGIILIQLFILILWYQYVFPLLEGNTYALEPYVPFCFRKPYDSVGLEQYKAALPWNMVIVIFLMIYLLRKNLKPYYIFVLVLLIFQALYMGIYNDTPYGKDRSAAVAVCYEVFDDLSQEFEMPQMVYSHGIDVQRLQFFLNAYQVVPDIPKEININTIFIYQGSFKDLPDIDIGRWRYALLGNNTYFFFQREEYIDMIKSMGYEVR